MIGILSSLQLALGVFALWFLYFKCWREYRDDAFRQRLFTLRDDLFDYAQSGKIAFDNPSYMTLRNVMNGLIRFTHRLTFTRFIVLTLTNRSGENPMTRWAKEVEGLPSDVRAELEKKYREFAKAMAIHLMLWSPIGIFSTAVLMVIGLIAALFKRSASDASRYGTRWDFSKSTEKISWVIEREALEQSADLSECLVIG